MVRENADAFEAVKVGFRHTKDGMFLTLCIHPSDAPHDVIVDLIGSRYMVALVRVNDQGEPVPGADMAEGRRALAIAQTLCRSPRFRRFMSKE